jgi:hypothetical protein
MITREELMLLKAQYLLGRTLTAQECNNVLAYQGTGSRLDYRTFITKLGETNKFKTLRDTVEPWIQSVDKYSMNELMELVYRIAVESTSIDSGIRIIKNASVKTAPKLMVYLYNLYMRDVENYERDMRNSRKTKYGLSGTPGPIDQMVGYQGRPDPWESPSRSFGLVQNTDGEQTSAEAMEDIKNNENKKNPDTRKPQRNEGEAKVRRLLFRYLKPLTDTTEAIPTSGGSNEQSAQRRYEGEIG